VTKRSQVTWKKVSDEERIGYFKGKKRFEAYLVKHQYTDDWRLYPNGCILPEHFTSWRALAAHCNVIVYNE